MARQMIVQLTDDLDGTPAQLSVRFGWDGVEYEIDLHRNNADAFAAALRPYLAAARPISATRGRGHSVTGRARRAPQAQRSSELATIRAWARENGHQLADRGRIPTSILDAYRASAGRDASPSAASVSADGQRRGTRTATKTVAKRPGARATTAKKTTAKKTAAKKTAAKATVRRSRS